MLAPELLETDDSDDLLEELESLEIDESCELLEALDEFWLLWLDDMVNLLAVS